MKVLVFLLLASIAQAQEGDWQRQPVVVFVPAPPPPVQPKTALRPMTALWAAGLAIFLGGYVTNIAATAIGAREDVGTAAIPFAGPWLQYGFTYSSSSSQSMAQALLATDGVVQAAGGALLVVGLSIWRKETRYATHPRWLASPWLGPTGGGLAVTFRGN
jgi:hypothetical protein